MSRASARELFDQAEIAKYSDAERRQYEASQKEYWDYTSTLETASDNRAKLIARGMKADGMAVEQIAKYTGLTIAEIENL